MIDATIKRLAVGLFFVMPAVAPWVDRPVAAQVTPPADSPSASSGSHSSNTSSTASSSVEATAKQIGKWIEQLADDSFVTRQKATKALRKAGLPAIPHLEKAARGANRERSARAVQILESMYRKETGKVKADAEAALRRVAASGSSAARAAREAIGDPKVAGQANRAMQRGFILPGPRGIRLQVGGIQLQRGVGGRQVTVQRAGGVTTTTLKEKGRTAKLVEDPQNGIKLEVTETKNGQPVTQRYQAKDGADLKRKSAAAYKVYQELKKAGGPFPGGIQMRVFGGGGGIPVVPQAIPAGRARQGNLAPAQAKAMLERVDKSLEKLRSVEAESRSRKALAESIEELESLRKELKKLARGS